MKRKFLALVIALVATVSVANAQLFVGGTAGFAYQIEAFSAAVEPMFGYQFNEKWPSESETVIFFKLGKTIVADF